MTTLTPFQNLVRRWEGACQDSIGPRWCGCGKPETVYMWIRDALTVIAGEDWQVKREWWDKMHPGAQHLLAAVLDDMDLVQHGGTWYGQWLTDAGKEALAILGGMSDDDIETARSAAHVRGCGCLPGPCAWCGLDEASYYARMAKR